MQDKNLKTIKYCLIFLCAVVGWEVFAAWLNSSTYQKRVNERHKANNAAAERYMFAKNKEDVPRATYKMRKVFEEEVRKEGNPYSIFW